MYNDPGAILLLQPFQRRYFVPDLEFRRSAPESELFDGIFANYQYLFITPFFDREKAVVVLQQYDPLLRDPTGDAGMLLRSE